MIVNSELSKLLELDSVLAEKEIKRQYAFYVGFDNDIKAWLNTMRFFACDGEFYELIRFLNQRLFN